MIEDGLDLHHSKPRLHLTLPLPPTDNHIYTTLRGRRGRILTAEAKSYKTLVASRVADLAAHSSIQLRTDVPYAISISAYFPVIENVNWSKGITRSRYRKVDTQNRQKLLVDGLMTAIGVDDSHLFHIRKLKFVDPNDPRVEITLVELDEDWARAFGQ